MLGGGDGEAFLTFILAMLQPRHRAAVEAQGSGQWPQPPGSCTPRHHQEGAQGCLAAREGGAWDPGLHRRSRQKLPESHPAPHSLAAGLAPGLLI